MSEEITAKSMMRTPAVTVSQDDTVATVARKMVDAQITGLPVVHDHELVGIITESDLIARQADIDLPTRVPILDAVLEFDAGRSFDEDMRRLLAVTAGDLMTSPVFSIREDATLSEVATLMLVENVNPVPVVDADYRLVGIVSRAELVAAIARLEGSESESD